MEKKNKLYGELLKEVSDSTGILDSIYISIRMDILKEASKGKYSFDLDFNNYLGKDFSYEEENILFLKLRDDGITIPNWSTIQHKRGFSNPVYSISWGVK